MGCQGQEIAAALGQDQSCRSPPGPPHRDVGTSTAAPRHGCGVPTSTVGLGHQWSSPQPHGGSHPSSMSALIPSLWVALPHRWPHPSFGGVSDVPQHWGPPAQDLSTPVPVGGLGATPPPPHPPKASTRDPPHTHRTPGTTRTPHPTLHPAPHTGQGEPAPSTQPGYTRAGLGGVSGDTYRLSPRLGRCCRCRPTAARSYPVYRRHTGVSPPPTHTPEQSRHPKENDTQV